MEIISLDDARAAGLKHYFTGQPCKRGHISQRSVATRTCLQCNRDAVREWTQKQPKEKRREKERQRRNRAKQSGEKYYFTGKPCVRGHIDKRSVSNHVCMACAREKAKKHFHGLTKEQREARSERNKRLWKDPAYRARHNQKYRPRYAEDNRTRNKAWKKANRARCSDRENKRNALLRNQFVEDVSLEYLFERDGGKCQLCGSRLSLSAKRPDPKTPTRDHIIPLSLGGLHERTNLQLACDRCNIRKQNRTSGIQLRLLG